MQFPLLQSGVTAQDWADKLETPSHSEYWLGGLKRQAIRNSAGAKLVWRLRYRNLLSEEAMKLRTFVESMPADGVFDFTDPWTGTQWESCRLGSSPFILQCDVNFRWMASVEVENAR